MKKTFAGIEAIRPGYPFEVRLSYPEAFYEAEEIATGRIVAHVRQAVPSPLAFALDSEDGSIRLDEPNTIVLAISGENSATLGGGICVWDFVRIAEDGAQRAIPGRWTWPVSMTVTRGIGSEEAGSGVKTYGSGTAAATFELPSYSGGVEFQATVVPGPQGRSFYALATAPAPTLGKVGDTAVNYATGDLYIRTVSGWGAPIANYFGGALSAATSAADAAEATAVDRIQTGLDRIATGNDRDAIGLDRAQTGLDRLATTGHAEQTALDRIQTGLDRAAVTAAAALIEPLAEDIEAVAAIAVDVTTVADNVAIVADAAGSLTIIQTAMLQMAVAYADSQSRYIAAHAFD